MKTRPDVRDRADAVGSTQETTAKTLANISDYLLKDEKEIVESAFTVNGFSFAGRGQNSGLVFVRLKDYAQRQHANQKVQALIGRMFGATRATRTRS